MNQPLFSGSEGAPPLRASTQVEALISNSPIAIVALDDQHRVNAANPAFLKLFGFSHDDLLAGDFDAMIAAPGTEAESRQLSRSVLQGSKVHLVTRRRQANGTIVPVEISGIPLMEEGRLAGVYALYQDLTERTQAQHALRAMADRVEAAQEGERRRIARDLHDATTQALTALLWNLHRLNRLVAGQDDALTSLVQQTQEIATQCSARIRSASYLAASVAEPDGLHPQTKRAVPLQPQLTKREREVMQLLAGGSTSREISFLLNISVRTVESHRINLNTKCGFHTLADLVRYTLKEDNPPVTVHAHHAVLRSH